MKKKYSYLGMFILLSVMSVFTVSAAIAPELKFKNDGILWYFSTLDPVAGEKLFSGRDVINIRAYYYYTGIPNDPQDIVPKAISLSDKHVKLSFDKSDLPPSWELVSGATGMKINVEFQIEGDSAIYTATGAGFGWRRRP